jgi:hypothetical protein
MKCVNRVKTTLLMLLVLASACAAAPFKNGFDLAGALVPAGEIVSGGPPRDGIPALDAPSFVSAQSADFLRDEDRVLGLVHNGIAKAYPIAILNWHEIVNDEFAGQPVAVSYCPLAFSGIAYPARIDGRPVGFGTSGLLYNSNLVMYDRRTQSLWPQLMSQAVSGSLKGKTLETLPLSHTTWADWRRRYPDTLVLSTDTGHRRDYARDPYADYARSPRLIVPVGRESRRFASKEPVIGLELDRQAKAYAFSELAKTPGEIRDTVAGQRLTVRYDPEHQTGGVYRADGTEYPSVIAYWFAWYAFHPDTAVFEAGRRQTE